MTLMNCKYHGYRTHDKYECHHTYKCQWQICMACKWKCTEHLVRISPEVYAETNGSVRDKECLKSECITHEKIPHHQLPITYIEWTFSSTPPFCCGLNYSCCCHCISLKVFGDHSPENFQRFKPT